MTDILNNDKKAIKEISADQIGNVSGGFIYLNKDTGMYEVINDKTWETVICVKDERSARVCCNAKGFNTSRASKSVKIAESALQPQEKPEMSQTTID